MAGKLTEEIKEAIKNDQGRIVDVAAKYGVSISTVSKLRPVRRKHVSDSETDAIWGEMLMKVPTRETAERYRISIETVHAVRKRAYAALLKGVE